VKRMAYALTLAPAFVVIPAFAQTAAPKPAPAAAPAPGPVAPPPAQAGAPASAVPAPVEPSTAATPAPNSAPDASIRTEPAAAPSDAPAPPPPVAPAPEPSPAAPAATTPAVEPPSLELFGAIAPTVAHGEPANPQLTNSFRRVGVYGEAGVAYRSKYFLDPFVSLGYATLASGDTTLPDTKYGTGGTLHQHLGTWLISPGVTTDLWRFRLRFGIGLAVIKQSFRFHGEDNTATQLPLMWQAGVGFNFYKIPRFRLDAEARFVEAKGADVSFWMLGITGRGDVATF